jgi:hypothetical protein
MLNINKFVEQAVLLGLFVAVIGSAYIFIVTIIFRETAFAGIFNTWHFPMLLAIFIDISFYKHISALRI